MRDRKQTRERYECVVYKGPQPKVCAPFDPLSAISSLYSMDSVFHSAIYIAHQTAFGYAISRHI